MTADAFINKQAGATDNYAVPPSPGTSGRRCAGTRRHNKLGPRHRARSTTVALSYFVCEMANLHQLKTVCAFYEHQRQSRQLLRYMQSVEPARMHKAKKKGRADVLEAVETAHLEKHAFSRHRAF